MTTLKSLETRGLQVGQSVVLNERGAVEMTKAIQKAGFSQQLLPGARGKYEGAYVNRIASKYWLSPQERQERRAIRFQLKGSEVTVAVHEGVDRFTDEIIS